MTPPRLLTLSAALVALLACACAGHQTPRHDAPFGSPPANYRETVQKYLEASLRYPPESRFEIGEPRRGYMNKGAFLGGEVMWVGYLVDVRVQSVDRGFRRSEGFVVRLRNDDVVEAHATKNLPPLHDL
jgi:hypothetical protein